nr:dephospho-CoA kinase isoform X1 [Ipomoea batatas]
MEVLKLWMKGCKIIVLDVPLLFESKMDKWTKPIIVVWVDPETQLHRLMTRDGSTQEEAKNRISSQMSLDIKKTKADIVIDNTGTLEALNEQFEMVLIQITKPLAWTEEDQTDGIQPNQMCSTALSIYNDERNCNLQDGPIFWLVAVENLLALMTFPNLGSIDY